jgi:Spy/CpxP family protein refolding chaperone
MKRKIILLSTILTATFSFAAGAQDHSHGDDPTPYAGFQTREIKSLSNQDIKELRGGGGWGLALPAELNGRPGPAHLLELKNEIGLSAEQVEAITGIYEEMRIEAIATGERFITAEAALSMALESPDLGEEHLRELLEETAAARLELRFIHLSRHLSTPELLTTEQVQKYAVLRGYAEPLCKRTRRT